jgi:hypothetical protein
VQDPHIAAGFFVAVADSSVEILESTIDCLELSVISSESLKDLRKSIANLAPKLQNLRFDGIDSSWQFLQYFHVLLQNRYAFAQRASGHPPSSTVGGCDARAAATDDDTIVGTGGARARRTRGG